MKIEEARITNAIAVRLLEQGRAAIASGDFVVDLGAVTGCDSSAVALLLAWQRDARAAGARLELQSVPANITSLATLYGVEALITGTA
jgi:phospholipid transport system transporter-binding protein